MAGRGLDLGNHTYSHRDLNHTPREEFEADVIRGETITRGLLAAKGRDAAVLPSSLPARRVDLQTRRAFEAFLSARGYVVAPVTVDNDDFVYAAVYADALRRGDTATATRIGDDYLRYMNEVFTFFEDVSRRSPAARSGTWCCCTRTRSMPIGSARWRTRSCAAVTALSRSPTRWKTRRIGCPTRSSGFRATRGSITGKSRRVGSPFPRPGRRSG